METTPQPQQTNTPATKIPGNVFAAISYLPPFLFLVTTLVKGKTDEFAFWHAKRGAALAIIGVIAWAIGYTVAMVLKTGIVSTILYIALALTALFLAWKAWNNQKNPVPVLDKLAEKIPLEKLIGQSVPTASTTAPVTTPVTNTVVEKKEEVMPPVQAEPVGGMTKPAEAPVAAATTPAPAAVPVNPAPTPVTPEPVVAPAPQAAPTPTPVPAPMPEAPAAPQAPVTPAAPTEPTQQNPQQ